MTCSAGFWSAWPAGGFVAAASCDAGPEMSNLSQLLPSVSLAAPLPPPMYRAPPVTRISRAPSEPWSSEVILIRIAIGFTLIAASPSIRPEPGTSPVIRQPNDVSGSPFSVASRTAAASTAPAALFTVTTPPLGTDDRYT
ncbi:MULTISPECIES: hypothetical protein [Streptomyces]|uniref:hypothetical protein n=1 Tax=Streptomyces TaxID=1883 RepID=UPI002E272077